MIGALAMFAGCQFDESGLAGGDADLPGSPDASTLDAAVTADAPPGSPDAASPIDAPAGTPDAALTPDAACPPVILTASKSYQPVTTWMPDVRNYAPDHIDFAVPAMLAVTLGNAANHCSYLEWSDGTDRIECAYKGGASVTHVDGDPIQTALGLSYPLVECRSGQVRMFPACGNGNAGTVLPLAAGDPTAAESISLTVNGDSWEGTTEATAVLEGSCDPAS
jgi:hypothetical protein